MSHINIKDLIRSSWLKHGFFNVLEHGVTRAGDAFVSIFLIWILPIESFSQLVLAQAWVAPCLFFFISPENVLYRDYSKWKEEGRYNLQRRVLVFRVFGWAKAVAAVTLASVSFLFQRPELFFPLLWAFFLALGPQLIGTDREFLRLHLDLKKLNVLTLVQKLGIIGGTAFAALSFGGDPKILALVVILVFVVVGIFAAFWTSQALQEIPVSANGTETSREQNVPALRALPILAEAIGSFTLWSHIQGVIYGWVQTMDLFFLGWFGVPARLLGLYGTVLKIGNFAQALPMALANVFAIWLGRRSSKESGGLREHDELSRMLKALFVFGTLQAMILWILGPTLFSILSRGRWSGAEVQEMTAWFGWRLLGSIGWILATPIGVWLIARGKVKVLLLRGYFPWGALSLVIFAGAAFLGGVTLSAQLGVVVSAILFLFAFLVYRAERIV